MFIEETPTRVRRALDAFLTARGARLTDADIVLAREDGLDTFTFTYGVGEEVTIAEDGTIRG